MKQSYVQWIRQFIGHQTFISTGTGAVIRDEQGRILLQKRSDVRLWGFPGGGQELGERIDETLRREVREEVGLDVEPTRLIGVRTSPRYNIIFPNGDQVQPCVVLFECRVVGGELKKDGDEVLDVGWFRFDELPTLTRNTAAAIPLLKGFRGEALFDRESDYLSNGHSETGIASYLHWLRGHVGHAKIIIPGTAGLIRDEHGRMLLQKRRDNNLWGFPGGIMELGESAPEAVRREVREEVGLDVTPQRLIGLYTSPKFDRVYPNGDETQLFISFFACQVNGGELKAQEEEVLDIGWFDADHLPPMVTCCEAKAHDAQIFSGEAFWR